MSLLKFVKILTIKGLNKEQNLVPDLVTVCLLQKSQEKESTFPC